MDLISTDYLFNDFWLHLAGLGAVALGLADLWHFNSLSHDSDLLFIVGGFAGLGLKIVNGSAAAIRASLNGNGKDPSA